MRTLKATTDADFQFKVDFDDGEVVEYATDIVILWDECARGQALSVRYEALRTALAGRWGRPVSRATAYLTLETALAVCNDLKKTNLLVPSLKSLVSKPQDEQPQS